MAQPPDHKMTPNEVRKQKERVKSWLLKHRIPLEEDKESKDLNVMNVLTLKSPYTAESCVCNNEIVLGKIQGLISAMPADVEDW